jgi:hypothetical protein
MEDTLRSFFKIEPSRLYANLKDATENFLIFLLFLTFTVMMTYPIPLKMGSTVRDPGDPLLNTWILAWDARQITNMDIKNFFNANIFYPHQRTLTYSEHMFSNSLIALPILAFSGNPILAYNSVLLLSFILNGLGMYLLAFYFTRDRYVSIFSGFVYAFSPFMFAHLSHLQVISAWAIPLSLLFLHKFLDQERFKDVLLFTFFYLFQILANGYYALYLTFFGCFFIIYHSVKKKKYREMNFLIKISLMVIIVVLIAGPFFYQYWMFRKETGFIRINLIHADILSYFATNGINRIYGKVTAFLPRHESALFTGFTVGGLALIGLRSFYTKNPKLGPKGQEKRPMVFIFYFLLILLFLSAILIEITGGFKRNILGFYVQATGFMWVVGYSVYLLLLRIILDRRLRSRVISLFPDNMKDANIKIYFFIMILSFLFTFGPEIHFFGMRTMLYGPYLLLYKLVPGFDGLRVPSRFFIFFILSVSIFAAIGLKKISSKFRGWRKCACWSLFLVLTAAEYLSIPIVLAEVPTMDKIPPIYLWLARKEGDFSIIELPLPKKDQPSWVLECPRVYYSSYHWKKIFNGYSGYFPPLYEEMRIRMQEYPMEQNIDELRNLGIRYIIVHTREYESKELEHVINSFAQHPEKVMLRSNFGNDFLYELIY